MNIRKLVILKVVILVGLVAAYYLPQPQAVMVSTVANLLWLFKT